MTNNPRTLKVGINLWSQATSWPKFLEAAQPLVVMGVSDGVHTVG
jgi:hypothetical protein